MVGLAVERFAGYLHRDEVPDVEAAVRAHVRACAGHRAVLCYAIANEYPVATVRWFGRRKVERYLKHLYDVIKSEDPAAPQLLEQAGIAPSAINVVASVLAL